MEPSLIITLIVAFIAIIPGIWALISQLKNDKNNDEMRIYKWQEELFREKEQLRADEWLDSHRPLYMPVIEKKNKCRYCNSILDISDKNCSKCGAPI